MPPSLLNRLFIQSRQREPKDGFNRLCDLRSPPIDVLILRFRITANRAKFDNTQHGLNLYTARVCDSRSLPIQTIHGSDFFTINN
ncbi:hypothetical protein L2E82_17171 [Cichorium intybus]|uniref:Uncharacterized protein n=1 Tax=Cichorium intybus TaxID=13427 RepID=A0ACB9F857_CICIN|nr:hypothetical protein L2E82_17171 [Cichorium intybus]